MQVFILVRSDVDYRDSIEGVFSSVEKAREAMLRTIPKVGYDEDTYAIRNATLDINAGFSSMVEELTMQELRKKHKEKKNV